MVFVSISLLTPMAFCSISNCRITPTSRIEIGIIWPARRQPSTSRPAPPLEWSSCPFRCSPQWPFAAFRIAASRRPAALRSESSGLRGGNHLRADPRHLLNGLRVHFAAHPNGLLQHFELPHHADQPHCGLRHRHVRTFELSLLHFHIGCRRRRIFRIAVLKASAAYLG